MADDIRIQVVLRRLDGAASVYQAASIAEAKQLTQEIAEQNYPDTAAIEVERVTRIKVGMVFPEGKGGDEAGSTWVDNEAINAPAPEARPKPRPGWGNAARDTGFVAPSDVSFVIEYRDGSGATKSQKVPVRALNDTLSRLVSSPGTGQIVLWRVVTEHLGIRTPDGQEIWNRYLIDRPMNGRSMPGGEGLGAA